MIFNQHEIPRLETTIDPTRCTGQEYPRTSQGTGKSHRKSRLKGIKTLITMKTTGKKQNVPGRETSCDQLAIVTFNLSPGEA